MYPHTGQCMHMLIRALYNHIIADRNVINQLNGRLANGYDNRSY